MRCFSLSHAVIAGALLFVAAEARAEAPPPAAPVGAVATGKIPAASLPAAPRAGVAAKPAPRGRRRPKPPAPTLAPGTPIATYPAFRLLDDGSTRVAVEVSRKVAVTEHKAQGRVVYRLAGVAIPGHNTHLPLPTGVFRTPVDRLEMVEQGDSADLVITLREAVQPTFRVLDTPRGIVLQVDFPRPAGAAASPPPEAAKRVGETKRLEQKATTDD
jgi:hypothetical protein